MLLLLGRQANARRNHQPAFAFRQQRVRHVVDAPRAQGAGAPVAAFDAVPDEVHGAETEEGDLGLGPFVLLLPLLGVHGLDTHLLCGHFDVVGGTGIGAINAWH